MHVLLRITRFTHGYEKLNRYHYTLSLTMRIQLTTSTIFAQLGLISLFWCLSNKIPISGKPDITMVFREFQPISYLLLNG